MGFWSRILDLNALNQTSMPRSRRIWRWPPRTNATAGLRQTKRDAKPNGTSATRRW